MTVWTRIIKICIQFVEFRPWSRSKGQKGHRGQENIVGVPWKTSKISKTPNFFEGHPRYFFYIASPGDKSTEIFHSPFNGHKCQFFTLLMHVWLSLSAKVTVFCSCAGLDTVCWSTHSQKCSCTWVFAWRFDQSKCSILLGWQRWECLCTCVQGPCGSENRDQRRCSGSWAEVFA